MAPSRHGSALTLICGIPVLVPAFIALARVQVAARGFARGPEMVLWMLLMVFAADIGAYFAGRSLGRHKLAPRVSPDKTWEGAIGGLAAVALVALSGTLHFGTAGRARRGLRRRAVGIFSVIGDLTESMFKRVGGAQGQRQHRCPDTAGSWTGSTASPPPRPLYALGLFGSGRDRVSGPRGIAILGSTGSIGRSTLDVSACIPERFRVAMLAAFGSWRIRARAVPRRFEPAVVVLVDPEAAAQARARARAVRLARPASRAASRRWPPP